MSKMSTSAFRIVALSGAGIALFAAQPALAAEATDTLAVSATVTTNCDVSTTAVAFGNVDVTLNQDVDGTGGISVNCTNGTAWTATAGLGSGTGATLASRKMTSGADLLDYALYTDEARTTVWGDGVGGTSSTVAGTGTGVAQANTIYGRIPSGQTGKPAGSYADTVTVTVTY